jgi:hypothetical protein
MEHSEVKVSDYRRHRFPSRFTWAGLRPDLTADQLA